MRATTRRALPLALFALAPGVRGQTGRVASEVELSPGALGFQGAGVQVRQLGSSVVGLGDLDGDGIAELAVGDFGGGASQKGVVWVLFPDATGNIRREVALGEGLGGFGAALPDNAGFGWSVAALGDVDGDGVPDLGVGAPVALTYTQEPGAFHVLFLRTDGTVRASQELAPGVGGFGGTIGFLSRFGWAAAGLGDLDGDGTREVAVSAPWPDGATKATGELYVLSLSTAGTVVRETRISDGEGGFPATLADGDLLGLALARVGDVDGDGLPELALSVGRTGSLGSFGLLSLSADGSARRWLETDPAAGALPGYERLSVGFYDAVRSLASPGDVDGDGTPDLLVGAVDSVWVAFLDAAGGVRRGVPLRAGLGGFDGGSSTTLGFALAGFGDLDGDGRVEAALGAPFDVASSGANSGVVWLVSLAASGGGVELDPPGTAGDDGPLATVRVRNAGTNPAALTADAPPVLGTTVRLTVDVAAAGGTGFAAVVLHERPLAPVGTPYGTLLVDPTTTRLFAGGGTSTTTVTTTVAIPNDPTLLGRGVHGQAVVLATPRPRLTNALAFRLGR